MTAAPDGPGGAHPLPGTRREAVAQDGHANIMRSLRHVDWLVLLVVVLYSLAPQVAPSSPRWLYAAIAAYTLFLLAFRLRSFPVRDARARMALAAAVMVAFITVIAIPTGGSTGPMMNLYLLPIVLVAMTLGARGALVVVPGVALAWLSVVIGEGPPPPPAELFARLFGELGPYALVAYLTQALAGSIMTARRRIEEMAERDGLTGMLNLRTFKSVLHREHQLRVRSATGGYAILLVDLDRLKELNDEHGHQAGNRAITTVAGAVQRAIRTTDMAARYGGDEFVVFLPGATPEVAEIVAQRIRNNVFKSLFLVGERLQRMTVSVGAASYPRDGAQQDDIVAAAGQRMRRDRELRRSTAVPGDASGQRGDADSAS